MNHPGLPTKSTQYTVENRSAATAKGTLQNRTWVTNTGPLKLDWELDCKHLLRPAAMSERCHSNNTTIGTSPAQFQGFYTTGISDCSVVAIFELGGGPYYFEHVKGSDVTHDIISAAMDVFKNGTAERYAVVAQYYWRNRIYQCS